MTQFLKICSRCRKQKWNSEFDKNKYKRDGHQYFCKECNNRNYQKANLKKNYGITIKQYELILESQNGVCKICGQLETAKDKNNEILRLAVDHDHPTGKIRGLLCVKCNTMLGGAKDNPEILRKGANYLEQHS